MINNAAALPDCLIELHLHVDGSLSVSSVRQLAELQGIRIPETDAEIGELISISGECRDLNEYLSKFSFATSLLQTAEAISLAVYNLKEELRELGFIYAELRFAPQLHCLKGLTQEDAVLAAIEGSRRSSLKSNLILCCMRSEDNMAENLETVALAAKYRDMGVCAVDLAGSESLRSIDCFSYIFEAANRAGLNVTVHVGEGEGPWNVWPALDFKPLRIGHGVRSCEDPELLRELARRKITLELCPTSNLDTKIFPDIGSYPLKALMDAGIPVTVNSDNMSVSSTNLRKEFALLTEAFGLSAEDIKMLLLNSAGAAFADDDVKAELAAEIKKAFE